MLKPILIKLAIFYLFGCAAPIRSISHQELINNRGKYSAQYKTDLTVAADKSQARLATEYLTQQNQSFDILVLSGGGAFGAVF